MNVVDIAIIIIVLLCGFWGFRKGVIRELIQLIGTLIVVFAAYYLKDYLANFLMGFMPFFQFKGIFFGISAINILVYQMVSFVVIFVLLYCILSIIINITNIGDKLLKISLVMAIPDKVLGLFVGLLDGVLFAFLLCFVSFHISPLEQYINDSYMGIVLLERTPFVGKTMTKTVLALEDITELAHSVNENTNMDSVNAQVIQNLIHYKLISKEKVDELIDKKKITLDNVIFS